MDTVEKGLLPQQKSVLAAAEAALGTDVTPYEREYLLPELVLDAMAGSIENHAEYLDILLKSKVGERTRNNMMMSFCGKYILEAAQGLLMVREYVQRSRSEQQVYLFLGTHWVKIQQQVYFDWVGDCCQRLGLTDLLRYDPEFMCRFFEHLAFNVSHYLPPLNTYDQVWVNLQNGTLEIDDSGTFRLREHCPDDGMSYVIPYCYDPEAQCPLWHQFLDEVLPQPDAQLLLAEYIGYCLTQNLKLEKMAVFYGSGANGKSVVLDVIEKLLGRQNISNVSLSGITNDSEKRTLLENKLANVSHESGKRLNVAMLKQLVSGEPTEVRELYRGTHTMYRYAKFFTSFNQLPRSENTNGFFRRWILFPFTVTIPLERQDIDLTNKLCEELPGILNWVLQALVGLLSRRKFSESPTCAKALSDYKIRSNSVLLFLNECCNLKTEGRTSLKELYRVYNIYCADEGFTTRYRRSDFREVLQAQGLTSKNHHGSTVFDATIRDDADLPLGFK